MQNTYISQLISALEQAAVHPPLKPYDERVLHFEVDPEAAEKALVPFKSIGQWTGIDKSSFPTMAQVTGEQCEQINKAILRVFDSLNLTIVDIPEEINPLIFYVVLTTNWDCMVQYLSLSGTELQFFKDSDEDRYHRAMSGISTMMVLRWMLITSPCHPYALSANIIWQMIGRKTSCA